MLKVLGSNEFVVRESTAEELANEDVLKLGGKVIYVMHGFKTAKVLMDSIGWYIQPGMLRRRVSKEFKSKVLASVEGVYSE